MILDEMLTPHHSILVSAPDLNLPIATTDSQSLPWIGIVLATELVGEKRCSDNLRKAGSMASAARLVEDRGVRGSIDDGAHTPQS
jgi:hypothetical protein